MNLEDKHNIKPGDKVIHIADLSHFEELVVTIEHKTHGIRNNPENSCCINGLYWYYDDIVKIIKNKE